MTSTNYSTNKFYAALKKNLKQHSGGAIAAIIISLLISFAYSALNISLYKDRNPVRAESADVTTEAVVLLAISTLVCGIYSFFASSRLFNEIYSKRSCDLYFAAPIKRSEYFNANMLFCMVTNAIIIVVPTLFFLLYLKFQTAVNWIFEFDYKILFLSAAALLMAVFAALSIFVTCAVSSGRKIHYIILVYICFFSTPTAISGVLNCINSIWGMNVKSPIFASLNPITNIIAVFSHMENTKTVMMLLAVSLAEFIITYAAGIILFKHRKAEVAEVSISGKIVPYVFLAVIALSAFMYLSGYSSFWPIAIAGIILAALVTLVFTLIFYKKPFTKKTGITCASVCVISLCFLFCIYFPNYTGYVTYVPEAEEIESVSVSNGSISAYYGGTTLTSIIENFAGIDDLIYSPITFTSENGINGVRKLHQKIVDDKTIEGSKIKIDSLDSLIYGFADFNEYDVQIVYNLKDGKKVTRTYSVNSAYVFDEFIEAFKTEEALSQIEPFNIDTEKIAYVELEYYDYNVDFTTTSVNKLNDYDEFLSLFFKDMLNESNENFVMDNDFGMPYYPELDDEQYYEDDYYDTLDNYSYYALTFYVKKDGISAEVEQELDNMTFAQMKEYYENIYFNSMFSETDIPIDVCYVNVDLNQENAFNYLNSQVNK